MNFPDALSYILDMEGINAAELARRMHKDRSTVSLWINGENRPYKSSIRKLNNVLKVVSITLENGNYRIKDRSLSNSAQANDEGRRYHYADYEKMSTVEKLEHAHKLITDALFQLKHQKDD